MSRLKRLRTIIFIGGALYLVLAPLSLTLWERRLAVTILVFVGMVVLGLCCAVYFYGFMFWKDK